MQVTFFGGALSLLPSRRAVYVAAPPHEPLEYRIQLLTAFPRPPAHAAVATVETPDAAAGSHIDVVNPLRFQLACAANVVDVVGVSSVDDDVIGAQPRGQVRKRTVDDCCRPHKPDGARRCELVNKVIERRRRGGSVFRQFLYRLSASIKHDALVAGAQQTAHHVRPHSSKT